MTIERDAAPRIALVTGVGRRVGIGAAIVDRLLHDGWDVAFTWWGGYDARMAWGADPATAGSLEAAAAGTTRRTHAIEADLEHPDTAAEVFDSVEAALGPVTALVMSHCESVDAGLMEATVESFDRHMAVNARATWLLVREFGRRFRGPAGDGRIVAMTSDATVGNLPYGASKAALDRIVLAAAQELAELGLTSNVINPGPTDTGWMDDDLKELIADRTLRGRLGQPSDVANLVSFLCSPEGGWINGQLLHSDGGWRKG